MPFALPVAPAVAVAFGFIVLIASPVNPQVIYPRGTEMEPIWTNWNDPLLPAGECAETVKWMPSLPTSPWSRSNRVYVAPCCTQLLSRFASSF